MAPPLGGSFHADQDLWGFGGLHGGLALALLAATSQAAQPRGASRLRSASGRFDRAIRGAFEVENTPSRMTGNVTTATARAFAGEQTLAVASVIFGDEQASGTPAIAPPAPAAPPWQDCEVFTIPPAFVPIATATEIRPVGENRPFAGGADPQLTAWIRLTENDRPPDALRLLFLADALAPAYAAVLTALCPIPTVELSVHLTGEGARADSPWVLVSARAVRATETGWISETIDLWDSDGTHLATARQLRIMRTSNGRDQDRNGETSRTMAR